VGICVCYLKLSLSLGLARTMNIRCIYGIFGREITEYTVIYGVYNRFWPTLLIAQRRPHGNEHCYKLIKGYVSMIYAIAVYAV
jgi:hypothetical protein